MAKGVGVVKYNQSYHPMLAMRMARVGHTEKEIAELIGVSQAVMARWKHDSPVFREALRTGKVEALTRVEEAVYKVAVGYHYEEEEARVYRGQVLKYKVRKWRPADGQIALKILERQSRHLWGDVQRVELTQTITNITKFDPSALTSEELALFDKITRKQLSLGAN